MCSQRIQAATRMASRRFRDGWCGVRCPAGSLLSRSLSTISDGGRFDLDIPLEFLGERLAGQCHRRPDALVRPVLPRGVDAEGVVAPAQRPALVVLAVPD